MDVPGLKVPQINLSAWGAGGGAGGGVGAGVGGAGEGVGGAGASGAQPNAKLAIMIVANRPNNIFFIIPLPLLSLLLLSLLFILYLIVVGFRFVLHSDPLMTPVDVIYRNCIRSRHMERFSWLWPGNIEPSARSVSSSGAIQPVPY